MQVAGGAAGGEVGRVAGQARFGHRAAGEVGGDELIAQRRAGHLLDQQALGERGPLAVGGDEERPTRAPPSSRGRYRRRRLTMALAASDLGSASRAAWASRMALALILSDS